MPSLVSGTPTSTDWPTSPGTSNSCGATMCGNCGRDMPGAADIAAAQVERIAQERAAAQAALAGADAQIAEWNSDPETDSMLDWWNELSGALRGEVVNAKSVREANTALRSRFIIFVESN